MNEGYFLLRTENGELYELKNSKEEVNQDGGSYTRRKKGGARVSAWG